MKTFFLIVVSALLLAGCSQKPTESYKNFTANLEKGDLNAAYGIIDSKSRAVVDSRGGVARLNESALFIKSHKGIKEITTVNEEQKGDVATAKVLVTFNDGFSGEVLNTFVKEGGSWKLAVK